MTTDRRSFLQSLTAMSAGALTVLPNSIKRALAIEPHRRTGTINDVEHIVILTQENRSFDHYFGTLRGVRGFGDPRAVKLPSGAPVWQQPDGAGFVMPFRPDVPDLGTQFLEGTPHNWKDTHLAWNHGKYDQWVPNKGRQSMSHFVRKDIPFHFALADAFTICDAYHCSFMGATDPNRYHMWTGWTGNDGKNGGPVLDNSESGYDWSTYPERLVKAGISWKVYQDAGAGLDAPNYWGWGDDPYIGNYGDNSLLYFHQYQNALPGSPLFQGARVATDVKTKGTLFDVFRDDVRAGKLPQISYITAPESYSEHPNWPANYGAWYISQILDILTENPEVFSKTVFFVNYDENDGYFDHVVPPTPPESRGQGLSTVDTTNELFAGNANFMPGPYGLGQRVPMIVISPWSKGGWVNSEVFDHTSLIRFIERRFATHNPELIESNITAWRRAVVGDLTSTLDFKAHDAACSHRALSLPSTVGYAPPDHDKHPDLIPVVPTRQKLPKQEPGLRPARPVPYQLDVQAHVNVAAGAVVLKFMNTGKAAAVFHVRSGDPQEGPWTFTVGGKTHIAETFEFASKGKTSYDLSVYGPNGFMRTFKGGLAKKSNANLSVTTEIDHESLSMSLTIVNHGHELCDVRVMNEYTDEHVLQTLHGESRNTHRFALERTFGWYDFTIEVDSDAAFEQCLAGHVEDGENSMSDPAFGGGIIRRPRRR